MIKRLIASLWVIGVLIFVTTAITIGHSSADNSSTSFAQAEQRRATVTPTVTPTFTTIPSRISATPTPLDANLAPGVARDAARATDEAYSPPNPNPIEFDEFPVELQFDEFFVSFDMRRGWIMTDKLLSLDGQQVIMQGYVAPPLKPRIDFMVLTKIKLAFCPFCSTDADWPDDIVLIYLPDEMVLSSEYPVRVVGTLEVGSARDADTGMVSLIRIYADEVEVLN